MGVIWQRYLSHYSSPRAFASTLFSLAAFVAALYVNFWAIRQATEHASNRVTDLILSYLPVVEVDGLFVYGTFACILFSLYIVLPHPKRISFALRTLALFILIRSAFTMLTHLAPPAAAYESDFGEVITTAFYGADQFFSAHTGMPVLGALAFWSFPWIRNTFLAFSAYFVVVVLIGHIHYSIDVASAFFITYGIYQIAKWLFPRDHKDFEETHRFQEAPFK